MPDPSAPPFGRQPEPVPSAPRSDGMPYATPLVRNLAQDRGVGLATMKPQGGRRRVVAADLTRPAAPQPAAPAMFLTTEADATEAVRAAAGRSGTLVAAVAHAYADVIQRSGLATGAVDVSVLQADGAGVVLLRSSQELSVDAIERRLSALEPAGPAEDAPFSILNFAGTGMLYGNVRLSGRQVAAVSLGEARRAPWSGTDAIGAEAICHRTLVGLTLTYHPDRVDPGRAVRLLAGLRGLLETTGSVTPV